MIAVRYTYQDRALFQRCHPQDVALPDAESEELDSLTREHETLFSEQFGEDDDENPDVAARLRQIERRAGELSALSQVWPDDIKARSGVILALSHDGSLMIERGLIRPEDAVAHADPEPVPSPADTQGAPATALSARLSEDLTAQKTAAIAAALTRQPDIALAAVVHALARRVFFDYGAASCLSVKITITPLARWVAEPGECSGLLALNAECAAWVGRLPANPDDLWAWCLGHTRDTLLDLLAVCAGHIVDAVGGGDTRFDTAARLAHADALAGALGISMQNWFTPTAANYFGRVSRSCILEALSEAGRPARTRAWSKLKKTELAALAEREIRGTGWLPQPLRVMVDAAEPDTAQTDTEVVTAA